MKKEDLLEKLGISGFHTKGEIFKNKEAIKQFLTGKKHPEVLKTEHNLINVGNKWFKPEYSMKNRTYIFVEVNKKNLDIKLKKIVEKLKPSVDPEMILRDAVMEMDLVEIQKLYENLFQAKRKPKPKQKGGCVEIQVGDIFVPLR